MSLFDVILMGFWLCVLWNAMDERFDEIERMISKRSESG